MSALATWIYFCAFFNCAGWTLSAVHQLNAGGYAVALVVGVASWVVCRKYSAPRLTIPAKKLRRRFRRGFPLAFLVMAVLAFAGGALHPGNNYDALAYRTPRVLHWLAAGQWHWIHTDFQRLNTRTAGFEWLTAPIFLFAHSDRPVFLLNIIAFLFLPGRIFAVLTLLGVRGRTAWYWMWLFPAGYGYILQAGSVVNDMYGAMMTFAAIEFALRAAREKKVSLLWLSILAAALMTSAKAFNILLLLPWGLAALPALLLLLRRPVISFVVIVLAASASIVPTAYLNWRQCGDWTGLAAEQPTIGGSGKALRFVANAVKLPLDNIVPPLFPFTGQWDHLVARTIPPHLEHELAANMETGLAEFKLPEMQVEESAGLGLGLTVMLLVLLVKRLRTKNSPPRRGFTTASLVVWGAWGGLLVFMLEVGSAGPARYLLPFYPLLAVPVLMGPDAERFFRERFWRGIAWLIFASVVGLLIVSPPRPLWPALTILRSLDAEHSSHALLKRTADVYEAYDVRADGFRPILAALPPDANRIGLVSFDEPETGLWRPFGSRQIEQFSHADSAADLRARGLKYALVSEYTLTHQDNMTVADWLAQTHAVPLQHFELKLLAHDQPHGWLLVSLP